jgi:hypothetical protein
LCLEGINIMATDWRAIRRRKRARRRREGWSYKMHKSEYGRVIVVDETGPPCPRCKQRTEVREHADIAERQRRGGSYFERWYCCRNPNCQTTLIMPPEFKVVNRTSDAAADQGMLPLGRIRDRR